MKKIFLLISLLTALLYFIETNENIGLSKYKPSLTVDQVSNHYVLTWSKIPYLVYYEVEILNQIPNRKQGAKSSALSSRIANYRTFNTTMTIDQNFPDSSYLRISAHSLFHRPLGFYSDCISIAKINSTFSQKKHKPVAITNYLQSTPAPNIPLLQWTVVPGAVYYELEILSSPAENPNDINPSRYQITSSREVFTNAFHIDLTHYPGNHLYWRVRALNFSGNPIGVFSDAAELFIDHKLPQVLKPISNTGYKEAKMPMPLYPVYSWIPIPQAVNYEIEVTTKPPENPNGTQTSKHQIRHQIIHGGSDYYDEEPLITPGTYYWRVRGLDDSGQPVGVYSDAEEFVVDLSAGSYAATFGDSISHGGGAISYSPADVEYSFQTYLSFPAMNLAKSGDTSETMLHRFNKDVLPYHPKFLIIMGGSNSLRGGTPAAQVIKELAAIRDRCLANGIRPIFLTLPPINPTGITQAFNEETASDWQKQFADVNVFLRQQRYYIDLEPYFMDDNQELPPHYATDGLHLDSEGKKLMGLIINSNWARVTK